MTVGASRAELTITRQPALAPSPQPRPAPTAQALPLKHAVPRGQNWTPIGGQIWKPIDSRHSVLENGTTSQKEPGPLGRVLAHKNRASLFELPLRFNATVIAGLGIAAVRIVANAGRKHVVSEEAALASSNFCGLWNTRRDVVERVGKNR